MTRSLSPRRVLLAVTLIILSATGCGGGSGDVTGIVTFRGQPLKFGSVQFQSPGGGIFSSEIDAQGRYEIKGCKAGTAKILVSCVDPAMIEETKARAAGGRAGKKMDAPTNAASYIITPVVYADFETSGLTFEVKSGANTHNIDLVAR